MNNYTHSFIDNFYFYPYLNTTMEKAQDIIEQGDSAGTFAVMAGKQRAGIGRKGNYWFSPEGGFYVTLAIYGFEFSSNFTLFLGSVIHKVLSSKVPYLDLLKLKWPNDLYYEEKKIAGIIVQSLPRKKYYLCGIGINSNFNSFPDELCKSATSLGQLTVKNYDNLMLLNEILDTLMTEVPLYLENKSFDKIYYYNHDFLNDRKIILSTEFSEFTGKYMGVNKDGAILLQLENGSIQPFYAGSVTFEKKVY